MIEENERLEAEEVVESMDMPESMGSIDMGYDNVVAESYGLREVIIKPLSSGYLVNVGCQSIAIETTKNLLKALGEYLENPKDFEEKWNTNKNRNKL